MKRVRNSVALVLALIFVLGSIPLSVSGEKTGAEIGAAAEDALAALDCARDGDVDAKTVSATVFLKEECGVETTEAEGEYLRNIGAEFKYSDVIPASCLVCKRTEGGITVTANDYTYTSSSGNTVRFVPKSAETAGQTKTFSEDRTVSFLGLEGGKTYEVTAQYEARIEINSQRLDAVINAAYREGSAVIAQKEAYASAIAEYERKSEEYAAAYASYLEKKNAYDAYLAQLEAYNAQKRAYEEYLNKKEVYNAQKAQYDQYLTEKTAYETALAEYAARSASFEADYKEYLTNKAQIAQCLQTLEVIETVFEDDGQGHVMYNTLKGNTVNSVLENKGLLESWAGVDPKEIEAAGEATAVLKEILEPYKKLKTDKERFLYYAAHYVEIRKNFIALYTHLFNLYKNPVVVAELYKKDRINRYMQFTAHLYLLSTCFDDETQTDHEWKIRNKYSKEVDENGNKKEYFGLSDLLSDVIYIKDFNRADPSGLTYPEQTLEEPVLPEMPTAPEPVAEPKKTWDTDLSEPTAPTPVQAPADPGTLESYAGKRPAEPSFTNDRLALEQEVRAGVLTERQVSDGIVVTLSVQAEKSVSYEGTVTVRFFDADRKTLLYSKVVLKGEGVSYGGKTPSREADAQFAYTFIGFFDADGREASLSSVSEDIDLYASYAHSPVLYQIKFTDHYGSQTLDCAYGEIPVPTLEGRSYTQDGFEYAFVGYEPAIAAVTGDASYTAKYVKVEPGYYTVVFSVGGVNTAQTVAAGEMPAPPQVDDYIDETRAYTFAGWTPEISGANASVTYTARFTSEYLVPFADKDQGARVTAGADEYAVQTSEAVGGCLAGGIFLRAANEEKSIRLVTGGPAVVFDKEAVKALSAVSALTAGSKDGVCVTLSLTDDKGADLLAEVRPALFFDLGCDPEDCRAQFSSAGERAELPYSAAQSGVTVTAPGSGEYFFCLPHNVIPGDANVVLSLAKAYAGDVVKASLRPDVQASILSLKLTTANGEEKTVLTDSFVMPDCDVTVTALISDVSLKYTVTFYQFDGSVLSTNTYGYNDPLIMPADPVKPSDREGYEYSFSGWEPAVIDRVIEDAEYRPVFKEVRVGVSDVYVSPYDSNRFISMVLFAKILPFFLAVIMLISGTVTSVLLLKEKNAKMR